MSKKQKEAPAAVPEAVTEAVPEAAPEVVVTPRAESPAKGVDLGNGTLRVDH